ncbi:MAG TPA: twin-arginine translocase subunit TatC [Nitrososphaeraceae archaeon]
MSSFRMSIPEHIDELRVRIIRIIICIAIITIFTMSFSIKTTIIPISLPFLNPNHLTYLKVYYPYPEPFNNIALQLTTFMKDTLLPSEVKFIQTAPGQVFFGQIYLSLLIGLICSLPIVIKEILGFVSPAFNQGKRKGQSVETSVSTKASSPSLPKIKFVKVLLPTFLLFVFGVVFSYVLVIPFTLDFLYSYGESIGAEAFLTVNDFITFVLQFVLGFGIAFQLPIIMYVLSLSGLTDSKFWQKNFRYAIIIITIFGAVITPDGSGITMWFVALPMIALYALGIIAIRRNEHKVITAKSS